MGFHTALLKRFTAAPTLPTTTNTTPRNGRATASAAARRRQLATQRFTSLTITIICGAITMLVFRGTIGITYLANFQTPETTIHMEEAKRVISQIRSKDYDGDDDLESSSSTVIIKSGALGPKIRNWDASRKRWLRDHPGFPNYFNGKPRILLVTGSQPNPCDDPIGDHYQLKSVKNKMDYCRIHGIEMVYNMATLDAELSGYWSKLTLMRRLMLSHPEMEWIWWIDSDAFFTDMLFEIPILKYEKHNLIVHGHPNLLFDEKSWIALNTGSFLLRNCQWSLDLLDSWAQMGVKGPARDEAGKVLTANLKGRPDFEADDQSALIYLLIHERDQWMNKVYLENSYYLHGFWVGLSEKFEEYMEKYNPGLGDERWPFVTHFVGCKSCEGGSSDYPLKRCLRNMERAFNFADNQLMKLYGFSHRGLSSPNVKRIRNKTTRPLKDVDEFSLRKSGLRR